MNPKSIPRNYSLVGHFLEVDPVRGRDFDAPYKSSGLSSDSTFRVTADNGGITLDNSGIRVVSFEDGDGREGSGSADRFNVVINSAAWTGREPT